MRRIVLLPLLLLMACSTSVPIRFGAHQPKPPVVAISNPMLMQGDPVQGRREFIAAQCIDCHRIAEDPDLPLGARAIAGPTLAQMNRYTAHELATRITSRSTGASEELLDRTMKDYAQPLTVRKLVDIVAYLRAPQPPSKG